MKLDRKEVELAQAQFYRLGQDMLAELCKAWLALDAAPEATAHEGHDPETIEVFAWDTGIAPGTTVRLVATSGGE